MSDIASSIIGRTCPEPDQVQELRSQEFQIIKKILEKIEEQSSWGKDKLKEEILAIIVEHKSNGF